MRKTWLLMLSVVMVFTLAIAGCGKKNDQTQGGGTAASPSPAATAGAGNKTGANFKIGMVTDVGGVNDKSFNQSAWEALQKLNKDTGATTKYLQSKSDTDFIPNLNTFVKDNYNMTWGIGYIIGDAIKAVATQNPNAKFGMIDNVVEAPNVTSVTFAENEGSFLVGVVAALTTKTNKVGFVGGIKIPVIERFEAGFKAGVAAAKPDVKVLVNYTGAFDKPDVGKAAASTMYNDGADVIFHASGATGNGVFNEAKDRLKGGNKVWVIGVDKDQSLEFGDDVTLTSMMKYVDRAVYTVSNDLINGKFEGGADKVKNLGLKEDGVGLPANNKNVSAEIMAKVNDYKQQIISGKITVPTK